MRTSQLQVLTVDTAYSLARGYGLPPHFFGEVQRLFAADAGVGCGTIQVMQQERTGAPVSVTITNFKSVGMPEPPLDALTKAADLWLEHPGSKASDTSSVTRISDLVSLTEFWRTEVFEVMHGWLKGRYPMAAQIHTEGTSQTLITMHRSARDFTDSEAQELRALQRSLVAA